MPASAMRIAILSRSDEVHSTCRLRDAAEARGHQVVLLPILETVLGLAPGDALARCRDREVVPTEVDLVIPRIGSFFPDHALAVLRHFERFGCATLNGSAGIELARDKIRSQERLLDAGLPVPRTVLVKDLEQVEWAVEHVGGAPVVIKPVAGCQGRRVVRGDSLDGATSMVEALLLLNQDVLVQELVAEAAGEDIRVLVVGGRVLASIRRRAPAGRFRSNLHQGGSVEALDVSSELETLAVRAAGSCELDVAGVDILEARRGPLVIEVNASPGLEGLEQATGLNLARALIERLPTLSAPDSPAAERTSAQ